MDACEAGASSSSSESCGDDDEADEVVRSQQDDYRDVRRCNEEQDYHSHDAVTRALKKGRRKNVCASSTTENNCRNFQRDRDIGNKRERTSVLLALRRRTAR